MTTKINKEQLYKLYCEEEYSIQEITKILNCSYQTIRNSLKQFGIKTRNKKESSNTKRSVAKISGEKNPPWNGLIATSNKYSNMSRKEIIKIFKENRVKWQSELRRKEERLAFNEKYECYCCGIKENLEIHHLIYTGFKEDFFNKKYWMILCEEHHGLAGILKRKRESRRKKS